MSVSRRQLLGGAALGAAAVTAGRVPERAAAQASRGREVEYWVVAAPRRWDTSPTAHDDLRDEHVHTRGRFDALRYVATEPNWGRALPPRAVGDNQGIPGPVLRAHPGDTLVVHFKNDDRRFKRPHTMHPHGLHYLPEMDGTFMGRHTPPGGKVPLGGTFTYRWEVKEDSIGVWPYHDHGQFEEDSTARGLFGAIVITPRDETPPDVEATIFFHALQPAVTKARRALHAINGRAFAGNTPTIRAKVGQDVAFNVLTLGDEIHTFHIHGHRWRDADGRLVDAPLLGPAEGLRARFTEDAAGRWLYHCHVGHHMHHGMTGYYVVEP